VSAADLAARAEQLVGVAPRRARRVAAAAVAAARGESDRQAEAAAWHAEALAAWTLGAMTEAVTASRRGVAAARRNGDPSRTAEARMTLAFLLHDRGDTAAALRQLDAAAADARGVVVGRVLHQRGLVLQRCGRDDDALAAYRAALPILRRGGDLTFQGRVHNNRGVLQAQRGLLRAAETELTEAHRIYAELGQDNLLADTVWNLGFVAARRGDAPAALARYDDADAIYRRHGVPNAELLLDRCELLLSVRLTAEARDTGTRAVGELGAAGMSTHLADGLLMLAQATLADGDPAAARGCALRAARLFTRQGRDRWALLARYVALRADERSGAPAPSLRRRAARMREELGAARWQAQALDCALIDARAALRLGQLTAARRALTGIGTARNRGPLELRVRAWHAAALLAEALDDPAGAARAVIAGLAIVDRQRAVVGATELRVYMAGHGDDLARLGVALACRSGAPAAVLDAAERWRAGSLRLVPVRPPDDVALAESLAALRRASAAVEAAALAGAAATTERADQHRLEQRVRELARRASGSGTRMPKPPAVDELATMLGERALVSLVVDAETLVAVTVAGDVATTSRLGPVGRMHRLAEAIRFAMRRLALQHGPTEPAAAALGRAAERLDGMLFGPLRTAIGDRPLVVVPLSPWHALPWTILPTCIGRTVTVAPSASLWARCTTATIAAARTRKPGRVALVAGPRLPGAVDEVARIAALYDGATVLTGAEATAEAALAAVDGAAVVHVAAHGRLRRDNPLFSALELADGPLTVYDLERLSAAPSLVVLSTCQSGVGTALGGGEILGLSSALFALGTTSIVATVVPVDDADTTEVMTALHRALRQGRTPAAALATVQARAAGGALTTTAASFVCYGAG